MKKIEEEQDQGLLKGSYKEEKKSQTQEKNITNILVKNQKIEWLGIIDWSIDWDMRGWRESLKGKRYVSLRFTKLCRLMAQKVTPLYIDVEIGGGEVLDVQKIFFFFCYEFTKDM